MAMVVPPRPALHPRRAGRHRCPARALLLPMRCSGDAFRVSRKAQVLGTACASRSTQQRRTRRPSDKSWWAVRACSAPPDSTLSRRAGEPACGLPAWCAAGRTLANTALNEAEAYLLADLGHRKIRLVCSGDVHLLKVSALRSPSLSDPVDSTRSAQQPLYSTAGCLGSAVRRFLPRRQISEVHAAAEGFRRDCVASPSTRNICQRALRASARRSSICCSPSLTRCA
jgi:hypothetical protein